MPPQTSYSRFGAAPAQTAQAQPQRQTVTGELRDLRKGDGRRGLRGRGPEGQDGQWSRTRVIVGNGGFFLSLPVASKASQRAGWLAAAAADGEWVDGWMEGRGRSDGLAVRVTYLGTVSRSSVVAAAGGWDGGGGLAAPLKIGWRGRPD
ncbi:hypothetical protein Purlil1_1886 [Purpureocillium lilacinum]|uniref:Uncharacterized protein n=1 Tax=Purpureocillium lilacinum TaxID=33203 RepID=A0ABR0CBJ7_PURLI|nr:hypothetical protein Purlil1_1886 [Purpureocillium lilacinum]